MRSDRQLSPFSKRRIAALPEVGPTGEMAIEIEVVVDGSVDGDEFLKRGIASETLHGSLSSSERLMGILRPVVQPSRRVLAASDAEVPKRRAVGTKAVGDDTSSRAEPLQRALQEIQPSPAIPRLRDIDFQHFSFMVDGPPELASLDVEPDENLVQVQSPLDVLPSDLPLRIAKLGREHRPEAVPPEPDGLMADVDVPFVQQVFDLAQRQRKPDVEQDYSADHRWRAIEITERITHPESLPRPHQICSDNAGGNLVTCDSHSADARRGALAERPVPAQFTLPSDIRQI